MIYFCNKCCIEFESSAAESDICPNCGAVVYQYGNKDASEDQPYILENSAIDTINKYENLVNFITNEVYPYIVKLYAPKYDFYAVEKVKFTYTGNFVQNPTIRLKLGIMLYPYKRKFKKFDILAQIFDGDWKKELEKEYKQYLERIKKCMVMKHDVEQNVINSEAKLSRIYSYKMMMDYAYEFNANPLTEEERKYIAYHTRIPNTATIEAIKELEKK